jgi:hypothetical protein
MPFIVSNCVLSFVYSKLKLSTSHKVDSDDEGEVASEECHCDSRSKKRTDVFNPSEFHIKTARWIFNITTES